MRRIYESRALERSADEPFVPSTNGDERSPRTIDWDAFSHAFVPSALRNRAISVSVTTDRDVYALEEPVRLTVEFHNRLPFPIRLRTDSPNVWTWSVDGFAAASCVSRGVPDRPSTFSFARNERKRFRRTWSQRLRISETEWEGVGPGHYTVSAGVSREDARGLTDRTTIEIRE
ncbi:hypothetical protein EA473_01400 [Natrarchaeobius chitinivorans]|uniref:DUF7974 domain-containing protein n=2 Tax=Natrarchaeobius chitinivorans TaxID=1679083 RepID=A0A3N6M3Q2_NATCH|nr:hypothetical protein EA473_01400 [Natrarchaeobius chitinivorans]